MIKEFTVPKFPGFYESVFTPNFENQLEDDIKDYCNCEIIAEAICDIFIDHFNHDTYEEDVGRVYADYFVNGLQSRLKNVELVDVKVTRPRYYNYETDKLHIKVALSEQDMDILNNDLKDKKFAKIVECEFVDSPGFMSYHSNDVTHWPQDVRDEKFDNIKLGYLMDYVLTKATDDGSYEKAITEHVHERVILYNHINYDTLIKEVKNNLLEKYLIHIDVDKLDYNSFLTKAYIDEINNMVVVGENEWL